MRTHKGVHSDGYSSWAILARFWGCVDADGPEFRDKGKCWQWTGTMDARGYGVVWSGLARLRAHRFSYEINTKLRIPDDMVIDHLCSNRKCVNPSHLEVVTIEENNRRAYSGPKDHCPIGHPYSGSNLRINPTGYKVCKACEALAQKKQRRNKKLLAFASSLY